MSDNDTFTLELEVNNEMAFELLEAIDTRLDSAMLAAEIYRSKKAADSAGVLEDLMMEAISSMPPEKLPDGVLDDDGEIDWEAVNEYDKRADDSDSDFVDIEVE